MKTLGFEVTNLFFDRPVVMRSVDRATVRMLSKFGAFVRRRSRSSIRFRKRASEPGQPPSAHTRDEPNLRTILFAFEPSSRSVVIGPVRGNQVDHDRSMRPAKGMVPELLEQGGDMIVREWQPQPGANWLRVDQRFRRRYQGKPIRNRRLHVAARPFMGPAFQAELPQASGFFENQVT